jgi:two-component system response regulator AtoC
MAHVLIVDDDANTRDALAQLVELDGYTTSVAGDLREARIQLTRQRPDLVFIDLRLPDGNGMDLLDDIESRTTTEIILVTGHASVETAVEALRLGAADYLTKPVNLSRVKAILSRVPRTPELKA